MRPGILQGSWQWLENLCKDSCHSHPQHCCKSVIKCSDSRLREAAGDSSPEPPLAAAAEVWTGTSSRMCLLKGRKYVKPASQIIVSLPEHTRSAFVCQHRLSEKKSASRSWASFWKTSPIRHFLWGHDPCWSRTLLCKLGSSSSAFSSCCSSWASHLPVLSHSPALHPHPQSQLLLAVHPCSWQVLSWYQLRKCSWNLT